MTSKASSWASTSAPPRPRPWPGRASRHGRPFAEQSTPWQTDACGQTEIHPNRLVSLAVDLIGSAVRAAELAWGPVRVRGIGVTGLAESGVLLDAAVRKPPR